MPFEIHPRPFHHPDAAALVEQIQRYYEAVYGGRDEDATEPGQFTPPAGLFLVGYLDGAPVACGGWRRRTDGSVEVKRMYVAGPQRAQGLGARMLADLEASAAAAGADRVVLNTGFRQLEAIGFYEANGYTRTGDRFGRYEAVAGAYFFEKRLG